MNGDRPNVPVVIDGRHLKALPGETILQVAQRSGIDIPTLCWLEGLSVMGGCRLCVVEVAEDRPLRPACATPVAEDMEVRTDSDRLQQHRRTIVELLFAEGNHVCAVCVANRRCELQDLAARLGVDHVRFPYRYPEREVDATHPRFLFDPSRCVLCTRCVRVCDEVEGAHVWDVAARGSRSYLVAGLGQPWGESASCTSCGKCVAVCPTGALVEKGRAAGDVLHDPDLVRFLTKARRDGQWTERVAP
jgi:bidirectional [NiFe] hydrogenase diaphorase subunit